MSNSEHFHSNVDSREYRINYSFNCDSSNVVYLLECTVCGVQYVGSTCTPFRLRFNNYKACSRKFNSGASVPQAEFFRHFTEEGHRGFLKDISVKIIDRLTGGNFSPPVGSSSPSVGKFLAQPRAKFEYGKKTEACKITTIKEEILQMQQFETETRP